MAEETGISLALGDGGAAMARFLRGEILTRFRNASLLELEDASHVQLDGGCVVVTTDSYVVDPPLFPGGDIGRLAVSGTVNDLLAAGAVPRFLTLGLVVVEGFPSVQLGRFLDSIQVTAENAGVEVIAGDTKVIGRSAGFGICINTTGLGTPVRPGRRYRLADACGGDRILVTGTVGEHALAILSVREGLGFEQRLQSDCAPLHDLILPLLRQSDAVHSLRDPTRSGLAGVLHDLAEATRAEVRLEAARIPVRSEVRFGCEMLGLDPLRLANEGKMVLVVAPDQVDSVLAILRGHPLGREATEIGEISPTQITTGQVLLVEDGGLRILDRTEGQPLPRLC